METADKKEKKKHINHSIVILNSLSREYQVQNEKELVLRTK